MEQRFVYNNKYTILLKDGSIHVIYTPTNKELKTYISKNGEEFVYIYPLHNKSKATSISKRDMLDSILLRETHNVTKLTKTNKKEVREYYTTLAYIKHQQNRLSKMSSTPKVGARIEHTKFGLGTLLTITGACGIIKFDDGVERKISIHHIKV